LLNFISYFHILQHLFHLECTKHWILRRGFKSSSIFWNSISFMLSFSIILTFEASGLFWPVFNSTFPISIQFKLSIFHCFFDISVELHRSGIDPVDLQFDKKSFQLLNFEKYFHYSLFLFEWLTKKSWCILRLKFMVYQPNEIH